MQHQTGSSIGHRCTLITRREQEVLHLVAHEYSTKEIASLLYLTNDTINSHRKNMMRKLAVRNTAGLIRVAFERRILNLNYTVESSL